MSDFWTPEKACFAPALDGRKRPVDSITSNIGHLLWSGIVDPDRADLSRNISWDRMYFGSGCLPGCDERLAAWPVEYPTASCPQAAPLLLLSATLGLEPGEDGPVCDPHLPASFGRVALRDVPGR